MDQNFRKLIISFEDNSKPIVLSDTLEQNIQTVADDFAELLKQDSICQIFTKNDCLVAKTKKISSILISDPGGSAVIITDKENDKKISPPPQPSKDIKPQQTIPPVQQPKQQPPAPKKEEPQPKQDKSNSYKQKLVITGVK